MTREEFDALDRGPIAPTVSASDLTDMSDRTLLWGYDVERRSWHVFLRAGMIELYVYGRSEWGPQLTDFHVVHETWTASGLVPNKRLYPEACDAEFCRMLLRAGVMLPFSTWYEKREPRQFHGELPNPTEASP